MTAGVLSGILWLAYLVFRASTSAFVIPAVNTLHITLSLTCKQGSKCE